MAAAMQQLASADDSGSTATAHAAIAVDDPHRSAAVASTAISRRRFVAHIDVCVRYLAAWLEDLREPASVDASAAESARHELWQWLQAPDSVLDDGTPLDFALFDAVIQRAGERLPRRGVAAPLNVTRAAWMFAEMTHAIRPMAAAPATLAAGP